jgi:hypothetical protein
MQMQDVTATGAGATDTLVVNRGGPRPSNSLPPRADAGPLAHNCGDTDTLVFRNGRSGAVPPSAGGQQQQQPSGAQHTAGLTDGLGGGGGRTSHTIHSGSTVGSDDPTATLRMKTPAAGLSARTGSSTGSLGEEATVSLRRHGGGGRRSGDGFGTADQQQQRGPGDDTLVINRAALPRAAGSGVAPASAGRDGGAGGCVSASKEQPQAGLLKPRRLGVLGKAQRVVPGAVGRPPLAPPAATAAPPEAPPAPAGDDAADANRKRKAEVEALLSPKPPLSVGDGKRRQSPADEVCDRGNCRMAWAGCHF